MEADRFDAIARSLTVAPSRRGLARLLGGLALGRLYGAADTAARPKKGKKKSRPPACRYDQTDLPDTQCAARSGDCRCSVPKNLCTNDVCVPHADIIFFEPTFYDACLRHDECFTTCGTTLEECADRFHPALLTACTIYDPANPLRARCVALAEAYALAVRFSAEARNAHAKAQAEVCCSQCTQAEGSACFHGRCCGDLVCWDGKCRRPCDNGEPRCGGACCANGWECLNDICHNCNGGFCCRAGSCRGVSPDPNADPNPLAHCSVTGATVCIDDSRLCNGPRCRKDADCGEGSACLNKACCGGVSRCVPRESCGS